MNIARFRTPLVAASMTVLTAAMGATAEEGPAPTVIQEFSATVDGEVLTVDGVVDWGGQAPVELGTDPTGDQPGGENTSTVGIDVTSIAAWVEDGDIPVATFAWRLARFDQAPPPEIVRYYWQFEAGGAPFALQAKTSDVASGANLHGSPEGIAGSLASYAEHVVGTGTLPQFRIRGNCEVVGVLSNCPHVAWASGEFDTDADEIRFHLPLDSDATPAIRPGATVSPTDGAWASLQAFADNTSTRDSIGQSGAYFIPVRSAAATLRDPSGAAVRTLQLSAGDEGAVTGSADVAGLAPGQYTLELTACFAGSCATQTSEVGLG